jgi:hypothetical protein
LQIAPVGLAMTWKRGGATGAGSITGAVYVPKMVDQSRRMLTIVQPRR